MAKPLPAEAAVEQTTDGLLTLMKLAFQELDVTVTFGSLETALASVPASGGCLRINLLGWEHIEQKRSRVGKRMALYFGIVIAQRIAGADWDSAWPVARRWFQIYELLRSQPLPNCSGVIFRRVTDERFGDRKAIGTDGGLFWGMLDVAYHVKVA